MVALNGTEINDVVVNIQNTYVKDKYTFLVSDLQRYVAMPRLLKEKKMKMTGGPEIEFRAQIRSNEAARPTALFDTVDRKQDDLFVQGKIPWRYALSFYGWDEREPVFKCGDAQRIVDYLRARRQDAFFSFAEMLEEHFWGTPTGSEASRDAPAFGVGYWLQRSATAGFNGGNPSGFSSGCAELSSVTYPRWRNYTDAYTSVTEDDLMDKLDDAWEYCRFVAPVDINEEKRGETNYGLYTNHSVRKACVKIAKRQNDNLGFDLHRGNVYYGGLPIESVPYLNADTTDPFIGLDWSTFAPVFQEGEWFHEGKPMEDREQPRCKTVDFYLTYNYRCTNRRNHFIMYNSAA